MKIEIPAFEPMAKCNEHLRHGPISIDLGDDVVKVVRCKDCSAACPVGDLLCCIMWGKPTLADGYCNFGIRRADDATD